MAHDDRQQWQRVKQILAGALRLESEDRAAYLEAACADEPSLKAEIETLIDADRQANSFLDKPAFERTRYPMTRNETRDFGTTEWSLVLAAGAGNNPESKAALESLCRRYWYPLYAEVRYAGHNGENARDLTQGFFAQLLERKSLAVANPDRGKFRNFLKTSIKHYLANQVERERALKRGGDSSTISLDFETAERQYARELSHGLTPDKVFDRRWARALLERVLERLREEMEQAGSADRFDRLSPFLMSAGAAPGYRDLAIRWGTTEAAIKMAVHRLRRRFGKLLREEVAHLVEEPKQVNEEIRFLLSALESRK